MGDRGPVGRREDERRRTNDKGKHERISRADLQDLPFEIDLDPDPLPAKSHWDQLLKDLWEALKVDPARKWMTSADWALTALVLDVTNSAMGAKNADGDLIGLNGNQQSALLKHMSAIGVTEAARMRLEKEVTLFPKRKTEIASVTDIDGARRNEIQ